MDSFLADFRNKSLATIEVYSNKLATYSTGRAHPSLIENLMVEVYGSKMNLKSLATISAPEAKLLIIQPWDRNNIVNIEKAIMMSDLGLSPQTEDQLIRVIVPALTGEKREEYKKLVKQEAEKARVAVRGHRRDAMDELKLSKEEKLISEDEETREKDNLQKEVDLQIQNIDEILEKKINDLDQI